MRLNLMIKQLFFVFLIFFAHICNADVQIGVATQQSNQIKNADGVATEVMASDSHHQKWSEKAQEVLMQALSLTGIQYKYGGTSPDTGFDCSGFVRYVFNQAAKITLPPTARAISQMGKTINKEDLQPGDLVFFDTLKSAFSHVGIYMGNNKFIHSPRTGSSVRVENMNNSYWSSRFNGAQRLDTEVDKTN